MISELASAVSAAASVAKLAHGALKLAKQAGLQQVLLDFNTQVIELQGKIMAASAKYEELAKIKDEAVKKLVAYENWNKKAARYLLTELAPGILVYAQKPDVKNTEPPHYLCPYCFEKLKRSILQRPSADSTNYVCHECKFQAHPSATPPHLHRIFKLFSVFSPEFFLI
jgi:hypothetical protein